VSYVVVDDHLLRDLLGGVASGPLRRVIARREVATTNLYVFRLARSVFGARGGVLTGSWSAARRRDLGAQLAALPSDVEIVPMRGLVVPMARIAETHRVSALGSEALAVAQQLGARLAVWEGDDGHQIRAAAAALHIPYVTVSR
jgi:hypothetical protein